MMNKLKEKKILIIIASFLIFLSCDSNNQTLSSDNVKRLDIESISETRSSLGNTYDEESNVFWIMGKGIVEQKQEIIEINISIEQRDKDVINASKVVNENINKVVEIAKSLGIKEDDIVTKEFSISPVERWIQKKDEYGEWGESEIIAYEVNNSILLSSEKIDIITEFINQSTIQTGNTLRINNINFSAKDQKENKIESREKAIEDALYKASFYEKRLEIKLGDIIHFQELSGPSVSQNDKSMPMMRMAAEAMPSASIYAGDSEIITEIYLGFKID